jgi:hypothetical protein
VKQILWSGIIHACYQRLLGQLFSRGVAIAIFALYGRVKVSPAHYNPLWKHKDRIIVFGNYAQKGVFISLTRGDSKK